MALSPITSMDSPSTSHTASDQSRSLFDLLEVETGHETLDLAMIMRQSQELDTTANSCAATILASQQFITWMATPSPGLVYIEGKFDSSIFGKISPISYYCGNFIRLLDEDPARVTLFFFCGQHVAANDPLSGPRGLVKSLLAQLLRKWPGGCFDCNMDEFMAVPAFHTSQPSMNMQELCQIFHRVLSQMSSDITIYCVIEDISRLDKDGWNEDYCKLLAMLNDCIYHQAASMIQFKVMMTSPTRSKGLRDWVPGDLRIEVGADNGWSTGPQRENSLRENARTAF